MLRTDDSLAFKEMSGFKGVVKQFSAWTFCPTKTKMFRHVNFGRKMSDARPLFQALDSCVTISCLFEGYNVMVNSKTNLYTTHLYTVIECSILEKQKFKIFSAFSIFYCHI